MDKMTVQPYREAKPSECERVEACCIPHDGVFNNRKRGKTHIVNMCIAKYSGILLDTVLLQGPDSSPGSVRTKLPFHAICTRCSSNVANLEKSFLHFTGIHSSIFSFY